MEIYKSSTALKEAIALWKSANPAGKIGFVATMGALHGGHITLVEAAKKASDIVIVSIFVNPTQFNDPKDLEHYPRTEKADTELLAQNDCDIIFMPSVNDMYPKNNPPYKIDLGGLDKVMEGQFRPGHFEGVCNIVETLLRVTECDLAFFGIKDFQQVAIVKHMVEIRNLLVEIVAVPIKRSNGGLALSSRNALLSEKQKEEARIINWVLRLGKQLVSEGKSLPVVKENMISLFNRGTLDLEYLDFVSNKTLKPITSIESNMSACVAAYCGKVRLIDNIQLN
ncbi:MAG: pantoate--beta-alanine ligase [Crocinitomicaceae bacterium]